MLYNKIFSDSVHNLDFTYHSVVKQFITNRQIFPYRMMDIFKSLSLSCSLRPTTRQPWDRYTKAFL